MCRTHAVCCALQYYKNLPEYRQLSRACSRQAQALLHSAASQLVRVAPGPAAAAAGAKSGASDSSSGSEGSDDPGSAGERLWEAALGVLDEAYERLDTALDGAAANAADAALGGWAPAPHARDARTAAAAGRRGAAAASSARVAGGGPCRVQRHISSLPRPQDSFADAVDNSNTPWSPARFAHLRDRLARAAAAAVAAAAAA
jgi:hypothetical protein